MKNVLLIGPYIGDFKREVQTFEPYARWIYEQLDKPNCFVSSHSNRKFLYDWLPEENFIPVFEHLTRDEENQNNYLHNTINAKDYKLLIKEFKSTIIKMLNVSNKNILLYNLPYLENTPIISWYQKIFNRINLQPIKNDYIIYIPDNSLKKEENTDIFNQLSFLYDNLVMVGDHSCTHLNDCINFQINYIENGYNLLIRYILGCKMVIAPTSHWTYICNLHHIPVVSWGKSARIYKKDSTYGFNNPYSYILVNYTNQNLLNAINYQLRRANDL